KRLGEPGRGPRQDVLAGDAAAQLARPRRRRPARVHRRARFLHHAGAARRAQTDDGQQPDRVQRATGPQLAVRLRAREHAAGRHARALRDLRPRARGPDAARRGTAVRRRLRRVGGRIALAIAGGSVLAFLVVPVLTVIPMSLSPSMVFELFPSHPGFTQYQRFFASSDWMVALARSVQVALGTMALATVMGTLAALGLRRLGARSRRLLEAALIAPRIVPSIVFAVAAYYVFAPAGLVGNVGG